MNNTEIIVKMMDKAVTVDDSICMCWNDLTYSQKIIAANKMIEKKQLEPLLFDHTFAKAFFGERFIYNLEQMVEEIEPLQYIRKFL